MVLAKAEYERINKLFLEDRVGTQAGVEKAEQSYNSLQDQISQVEHSLRSAEINLGRSVVRAPFDARIKSISLEKEQYVSPGMNVVTLADDSVLEINVPIDSRDSDRWLLFDGKGPSGSGAWFNGLKNVKCKIRWTESMSDSYWTGTLHRVVEFDKQTRTLTVAVRVEGKDALSADGKALPLVEGMFCSVEIPGKTLEGIYRVPRWAVSFENTVYLSINNRLKTVPVKVARMEGEDAFIYDGLEPGDTVIITRLINPLENSLLNIEYK